MVWGSLVVCHAETKHTVEIDLNALARGLCEAEPWDLQPGLVQLVWFQYRDLSKGIQVSPTKKSKLFSLGVCVQDGEGRSVNFQMKIRNRSLQAMHAANVDVARQAFDYALRLIQRMAAIKSCPPGVLTVDLGDVEKVATCITSFDTGFSACENRGIDRQKLRREVEAQPIWHFGQKTVQLHIKDTKCWGVPLLINMSSCDPFNVEVHMSGKVQLKGVKKRTLDDAYAFMSSFLTVLYPRICTGPGVLSPASKNRKRRLAEVA